jgi:FMN reductase
MVMSDFGNGNSDKPLVVGIGGTTRTPSSTDRALRLALRGAEDAGAIVHCFSGPFLVRLPHFAPEHQTRSDEQRELVEMVRRADGLIVASPGYHGGVSGLVKNALDLLEDLRGDERSYLDGRAVGLVVTAAGWQAAVTTLEALRAIVHALRGWPTPLGAPLNTIEPIFDAQGNCTDTKATNALTTVGQQVVEFAVRHAVTAKRSSQTL